jgi:hypothetical protein
LTLVILAMFRFVTTLLLFLTCLATWAQAPASMSYQAVLRDNAGNQLVNQTVTMEFAIRAENPEGNIVFEEYHDLIPTNQFGLITTSIGTGVLTGNGIYSSLTQIPWEATSYFLEVRAVIPGEGAPLIIGVSQLLTVPYAHFATKAATVISESDGDPTNELIEDFSLSGSILSITENNVEYSVDLSTITGMDDDNATDNEIITQTSLNSQFELEIEEGTHTTTVDLSAVAYSTWNRNSAGVYNLVDQIGVGTSAPNSTLDIGGSLGLSVTTLNGESLDLNTSNANASTVIFICDVTTQDVNIQLLSAANCPGRIYKFRKLFNGSSTSNNVNINAPIGESIDFNSTYVMSHSLAEFLTVASDGNNWFVIDHSKD